MRITLDICRASPPVPKTAPYISFCSLRARLGSLRILAVSTILFKSRVHTLSLSKMSLRSILLTLSKNALPLPQSYFCPSLQPSLLLRVAPLSNYNPLSWTIVPFLRSSLHNALVGDGYRWRRRRDQADVTRRGPRQTGLDQALGWFAPNWKDATTDAVRVAKRCWRK